MGIGKNLMNSSNIRHCAACKHIQVYQLGCICELTGSKLYVTKAGRLYPRTNCPKFRQSSDQSLDSSSNEESKE
jgi:hypothetical protein